MRIRPWNVPPPEGAEKSVRVLGSCIECDGGARTDSQKRKQAAGTLWSNLRPQLPRLSLTSNMLGRVIEACIVSSMFYAAEVRTFTQVDFDSYDRFLGKIVRYATWNPRTNQGLRHMEGKKTMRDLFRKLNLLSARWYVLKRRLGYLGHLATFPGDRLEQSVLRIFLSPQSEWRHKHRTTWKRRVRQEMWSAIESVMSCTDLREQWREKWSQIAQDRKLWKLLTNRACEKVDEEDDEDKWEARHSQAREADRVAMREEIAMAEDVPGDISKSQCLRCGMQIVKRGVVTHLSFCRGQAHRY